MPKLPAPPSRLGPEEVQNGCDLPDAGEYGQRGR